MTTIQHILSTAHGGLMASQAQVAVASHNLANVNTPGYAHEVLPLAAALGGLGVTAQTPHAMRNALLERALAATAGRHAFHQGQLTYLSLAEGSVNDLDGTGLGPAMRSFEAALSAASANPAGMTERQEVLQSARALAATFATTRQQLETSARGAREQAQAMTGQVNNLTSEIAALNGRIRSSPPGSDTNSLIARRSAAIQQLSGMIGVDVLPRGDGTVQVTTAGGRPLVESTFPTEVVVESAPPPANTLSVSFARPNGTRLEAMGPVGGELGGLIEAHNQVLGPAVRRLDEIAYNFMDAFNAAHSAGYNLSGGTGFRFFDLPAGVNGAAASVALSPDVDGFPEHIAAALDPTGVPGDNRNLQVLAELMGQNGVLPDGASVDRAWQDLASNVTSSFIRARSGAELEAASLNQIENMLASQTGVSIDEELMRIAQANTALEAATHVIREVQRMTDTVLALVR